MISWILKWWSLIPVTPFHTESMASIVIVVVTVIIVIVLMYLFVGSFDDPLRKLDAIRIGKLILSSCFISDKGFSNSKFKTTSAVIRPSPCQCYWRLLSGRPLLCPCVTVCLSSKGGAGRRLDSCQFWAAAMAIDGGGGVDALVHRLP